MNNQSIVVGTIATIVTIMGTVMAISNQFITKAVFSEFKDGTIVIIEKRLDKIDDKLDKILEQSTRHAR